MTGPVTSPESIPVSLDGISLLPYLADPARPSLRPALYTEEFAPNGPGPHGYHNRALRDAEWKLIREESDDPTVELLFRLEPGAWDEGPDLVQRGPLTPEAQAAFDRLRSELDALSAELRYGF